MFRVALMGIYHESNTFITETTSLENFKRGRLLRGEAIKERYRDAHHEIGGMLEVMNDEEVEVIPLLFASAVPGGVVEDNAYRLLLDEMMDMLKNAMPVDGCLVVPHGAAVAQTEPDMDGHWLSRVREIVGPHVPIAGTLDPHANLSQRMVDATDVLVAYQTNPHIDQRQTGKRAAKLLTDILRGRIQPVQYLAHAPVAISIEQQNSSQYPCTLLFEKATDIAANPVVLNASVLLGFPYADVAEMGTSFLIVTNNDISLARSSAEKLLNTLLKHHTDFVGHKEPLAAQLSAIISLPKPVLLLDMGDNVGGGSNGDNVFLLHALERDGRFKSFVCIHDPAAVQAAACYHTGDEFDLSFGKEYETGKPYHTKVTLLAVVDGKFSDDNPRHGGEVNYDMGPTVIVNTDAGNTVMIHSVRLAPFSLNQLLSFGIKPGEFDVLTAKGVNAPVAAYGEVCPIVLQADTPGVTQADMTRFTYRNIRRPMFPFEPLDTINNKL